MTIPFYQIDAFTTVPFGGNPAAVCVLPGPVHAGWMQRVAAEMNLSETAFLHPMDGDWSLRWFTPVTEVNLCGHATLASAHALWESGLLAPGARARFHTRSGLLTADRDGDLILMDFPAIAQHPSSAPEPLLRALGVTPIYVGRFAHTLLLELADADTVARLEPDFPALAAVPDCEVCVTARANRPGHDFVSRYFAPGVGIDEDPVTGSAHCALGPYWAHKLGKHVLVGYQASARGGTVKVTDRGERVTLAGGAVTVVVGTLRTSPSNNR